MMEQVLAHYSGHDLTRQNAAALMDRVDTKYLLTESRLLACLQALAGHYSVLEIDGNRGFVYENHYYDNARLDFYHAHHNTRLKRYKVRQRRYVESGRLFFEVKLKNNKKRTIKRRVELDIRQNQQAQIEAFLGQYPELDPAQLEPAMFVSYRRCTLLNPECSERVTLDTGLHFHSLRTGRRVDLPGVAVVEAKTSGKASGSAIMAALKEAGVRPMRLSKYCTGIALTDTVKHNAFKPKLRHVEQLVGHQLETLVHAVN